MSFLPQLMALVKAELVEGTIKFGTLLRSLILLQVIFTPSVDGRRLKLALSMVARHSDTGSPFSSRHENGWKVPPGL